jgi:hypothetical protein
MIVIVNEGKGRGLVGGLFAIVIVTGTLFVLAVAPLATATLTR